jgi:SAM-dependent methyltransferase
LVPNKHKVFSEIFRVLKPGGHFSISDIVLEGNLPEKWKQVAELYVGCVSGAIDKSEYLDIIHEAGFANITLQKEKNIDLPDEVLNTYLSEDEIKQFKKNNINIQGITVYGEKAAKDSRNCCEPGSGCC